MLAGALLATGPAAAQLGGAPAPSPLQPAPLPPGPKAPPVDSEPSPTEAKLEPNPVASKIEQKLGIRVYGMFKPTVIVGNGLESFGNPTYVAITGAANPLFLNNPNAAAVSFQVQQTRLGMVLGEGTPLKALAEIDFVDASKSSPVQSANPRLRQAYLEWQINPNHKLTLGQLWDTFSPLNSHTFDLVGGLFQSGNSGFMRQQLIYTATYRGLETALALGMTNQNLSSSLSNVEYGRMPTIVARVSYRPSKDTWFGAAAMISRISFDATLPTERTRMAGGANAFADLTMSGLNLRAEAYGGQNLSNLGMLTLGMGTRANNVSEVGGYVSAKYTFLIDHAVHLIGGAAFVLNPSDMALGYTPAAAATATSAARALARVAANGPGMEHNATLRVGYAYSPLKGLALVMEPGLFLTKHKLDAAALALHDPKRIGWMVQSGALYTF